MTSYPVLKRNFLSPRPIHAWNLTKSAVGKCAECRVHSGSILKAYKIKSSLTPQGGRDYKEFIDQTKIAFQANGIQYKGH